MSKLFDQQAFGETLQKVLSPSRAIQSAELLKGRDLQLQEINKAWFQPGRQVFIHGYRGVGKTSLAHTAAFEHQPADSDPILLTFEEILRDMCTEGSRADPSEVSRTRTAGLGGKLGEIRQSIQKGKVPLPASMNEAIELAAYVAHSHSKPPVVIIDEFDLLRDKREQAKFANFVKQIGDQGVALRIIFCGIGETIDELLQAHESAYRYFHTVKLDRLEFEPRFEIVTTAADAVGISIDETTTMRIAKISDGFPHFIHLVCEKLFWAVFDASGPMRVTGDHYEGALKRAVEAIAPHLKKPYEKATRKYKNDYEEVLWAVADDHQLQRPTSEILQSYLRIMEARGKDPLTKTQFYGRMNSMKKDTHGAVLMGTRSGWYEFKEKMLRGYARLRASQEGVELDIEHPLQAKRFSRSRQLDFEDYKRARTDDQDS